MKKQVMKRAWELAKAGVNKFGGKVREYFATSLSIAWEEIKTMAEQTFNASEIELVAKRGHNLIIAVPTAFGVQVADGLNNVKDAFKTTVKNGVEYNLHAVFMEDSRYAPFVTIGDGFHRTLKADITKKVIYLNNEKKVGNN